MKKIKYILGSVDKSRVYLLLFVGLFLVLFTILGIKGFYSRYAQDDYCYGYRVRIDGFWKTQVYSYFHLTEYSSNRFSSTLFQGISEVLGGSRFVPFVPSLEIISWACALTYLIFCLFKPMRSILVSALSAMIILFFSFYLSPNPYQNLYWLPAILAYLTPIVFTTSILGIIFHLAHTRKFTIFNLLAISFLGFLAGGFSETTVVWQFSIWVCVIIWLFFFERNTLFMNAKNPLITVLVSTLLATTVMIINPTNSLRGLHYEHPGFLSTITQSLFFGEEFIRVSVKAAPIPFGVVFLFGLWLSAQFKTTEIQNYKKHIMQLIATVTIIYLLCVVTMTPYVFEMGVYPGDRELFPTQFTLITGLFVIGWILAKLIFAVWPRTESMRATKVLSPLLGILLFAYMVRAIPRAYDKMPLFQARAQAWDSRQQMIVDAKAAGESDVIIPQFDSNYGITELKSDPTYWINFCAAKYYGVDSITAVDGYLGISSYPIGR